MQRNYTFPGCEGQDVEVNIYADADEVELLLNGRSLGRKPCTEAQEYLAVFRFAYEPGTLEAVSYKNGVETGRDTLATASKTAALRLTADRPAIAADGKDLCFVQIQCVDAAGNPVLADQREIKVELLGGRAHWPRWAPPTPSPTACSPLPGRFARCMTVPLWQLSAARAVPRVRCCA